MRARRGIRCGLSERGIDHRTTVVLGAGAGNVRALASTTVLTKGKRLNLHLMIAGKSSRYLEVGGWLRYQTLAALRNISE